MRKCKRCTPTPTGGTHGPMADSKPKRSTKAAAKASGGANAGGAPGGLDPQWLQEVQQLSYREAQGALDLTLAQLQSSELEVEDMAGLYRRAEAYADRCQAVLESVQQEVIQWNP